LYEYNGWMIIAKSPQNSDFPIILEIGNRLTHHTILKDKIMALVYWTQDLNTGFADVDEQHQILVDHFNKLDDAFKSADYEATKKELQDLIDYTIFHFGEEEKMLEAAHYRMTEPHKKVHANFIKKMGELQGRFENGDITALQEVLDMCDGWLFRHIRLNDHGYIADVKAAGVR
jgi:hypothetical protein